MIAGVVPAASGSRDAGSAALWYSPRCREQGSGQTWVLPKSAEPQILLGPSLQTQGCVVVALAS